MGILKARARAITVLLAVFVTGAGALAGPVSAARFHFNPMPWVQFMASLSELVPGGDATLQSLVGPSSISYGSDGRLTVLVVGSDWRERLVGTGERTDVMMVVSVNPNNHRVAAASVPRDVGNFPISPGVIYKPKVNGLFKSYKKACGARECALESMRKAFEYALAIQIDYVAYIRFGGVETLVHQENGIPVNVKQDIYDSRIVDERATAQGKPKGAEFLAGYTVEQGYDAPLCWGPGTSGSWTSVPNCKRALLYVRSRHGPGNNDWVRAKRQQDFLMYALYRVQSHNTSSTSDLTALRSTAVGMPTDFYTTVPSDSASVLALFNVLKYASFGNFAQVVFKPTTYAFTVPGTSKQELKIDVVRAWTSANITHL